MLNGYVGVTRASDLLLHTTMTHSTAKHPQDNYQVLEEYLGTAKWLGSVCGYNRSFEMHFQPKAPTGRSLCTCIRLAGS